MIIHMKTVVGRDIFAGALTGKSVFASCVDLTSLEPNEPTALFFDFAEIEVATASALRESVVALKGYKRSIGSNHYPVLANINESIADEIEVLMDAKNDTILACEIASDGEVSGKRLIGSLDPKQRMTFDIVTKLKRADAGSLMRQFGDLEKTKSTTAWNNRLSGLVQRGLLREFSSGRSKYYRPILEEVD